MLRTTILALLLATSALAQAAPPTQESVESLLRLTRAQAMLEQAYASMEALIKQGLDQQAAGRTLSDEQKRAIEIAPARIAEVMRKEMSWETLQPIYVAIYRESFSQEEVDGLIAFYNSPIGQSFVSKMPAVMQRSMAITQVHMQALAPKLKAAMDQVLRDARLPPKT